MDRLLAGNDVIRSGNGSNVVIGGAMRDTVTTGNGTDVLCGDFCNLVFNNTRNNSLSPQIQSVVSTCTGIQGGMATQIKRAMHGLTSISRAMFLNLFRSLTSWQVDTRFSIVGKNTSRLLTGAGSVLAGNDVLSSGSGNGYIVAGDANDTVTTGACRA
jgi:Ca2+-binding RTX toxin-like protein